MIDLLLVGGAVLTVDADDTVISPGAVAVDRGRIVAVGTPGELTSRYEARTVLHRDGAVIMPGWVNTHTHLAMQLFRGLTDDVSLEQFLDVLVRSELALLSEETVKIGVRAAIAEAIMGGVTTALDMYWYPRAAREIAREAGFRLLNGPTFLGVTDVEGRDFEGILDDARAQLGESREEDPDGPLWVMPHSTYTLSVDQLERIATLALEHGARVNTHASESMGEIEAVELRHHRRPIDVLDAAGLLRPGTVLAHGVQLSEAEALMIAANGATVAHCPVSNLKLGCGVAPVKALRDAGVVVSIGTDGAASGGGLDMFENARLTALLAKGNAQDPLALTARDVVRMGTADGAAALGLTEVGRIEPGMLADLQVVGVHTLHAAPADAYSAIVYSARAGDVTDVVIAGRVVLADRSLLTIDHARALEDLTRTAQLLAQILHADQLNLSESPDSTPQGGPERHER